MYKIVGIKKVHFTAEDGKEVNGTRFYVTYEDDKTVGYATTSVYCNDKISVDGLAVGDTIEVHYNKYGKVSMVELI